MSADSVPSGARLVPRSLRQSRVSAPGALLAEYSATPPAEHHRRHR